VGVILINNRRSSTRACRQASQSSDSPLRRSAGQPSPSDHMLYDYNLDNV